VAKDLPDPFDLLGRILQVELPYEVAEQVAVTSTWSPPPSASFCVLSVAFRLRSFASVNAKCWHILRPRWYLTAFVPTESEDAGGSSRRAMDDMDCLY
jgi:hypothetical protein